MTRTLLFALLLLPTLAGSGHAHPHVYVDASLTFEIDGSGLAAMRENWLFDDIFTQAILGDLGLGPDTLATPEGQAAIKSGAFDYLSNFGYFTFLENNGRRIPVNRVRAFSASLRQGRLVYDFTVPIGLGFAELKDFRAAVFDSEYYTDILLLKDDIRFEIGGPAQVSHAIRPAKDHAYWQFIVPEAVHLAVSAPGADPAAPDRTPMRTVEAPSLLERGTTLVRTVQKELTLKLNGFGLDIRADPVGPALWWFLAFSFLYGIVHAVGPGHGKAVVCSYFLSHPGSLLTGALMGNAITFIHMGSAAAAVAVAYLVLSSGLGGVAQASLALQPASYALVALVGLFLLAKTLRDLARGGLVADPSCTCAASAPPIENTRQILLVAFVTGLVPCPGAAVILAFALGQQILWAGIFAILAMAAGMGVTTTLFAWGAVAARSATLRLSSRNRRLFNWLYAALALCGAAAIILIGAALFISSPVWH
ncbi:MAG: DUF1007 family protein [Pseudodesulfovibrio sp.]